MPPGFRACAAAMVVRLVSVQCKASLMVTIWMLPGGIHDMSSAEETLKVKLALVELLQGCWDDPTRLIFAESIAFCEKSLQMTWVNCRERMAAVMPGPQPAS